jgi:glycerol-3-phosphate dehydrogenase (NAD(P)+)
MDHDIKHALRRREKRASGRLVVHIDPGLHALLRKAAAAAAGRLTQLRDGAQVVLSAAADYAWRAEARLGVLEVLSRAGNWADVIRESQEVVELALKDLLRSCGVETPRIHDVSDMLLAEREEFMATIVIIGAGFMGTAVAWPLSDNGHQVRLVGTHLDGEIIRSCLEKGYHPKLRRDLPANVQPCFVEQLGEALGGVEFIVSGVNSLGVHWIGRALGPLLRAEATIIAVTKGLEVQPGHNPRILPDVLREELPAAWRDRVALAAIGGPCIAGELAGRRQTCVVFTSRDEAALRRLRDLFQTSYYHIRLSTDIFGIEICAALKNAYTLAVGFAGGMLERAGGSDAADAGMHNLAAALFAASAREMSRIVTLMGGGPENVIGLPGVGDQFVTCVGGRTIRMGRLLGKGLTYSQAHREMAGETLEGVYIVQQLAQALPVWEAQGLLGRDELPLTRLLIRVVTQEAPVEIPFDDLFS